jgi:hypothetical protein
VDKNMDNKNIEPKIEEQKVASTKVEEPKIIKEEIPIMNVFGRKMEVNKYFYKGIVPSGFKGTCGNPVDRDDLIDIFHKVFDPKDNILFYRQSDKEVYIVIIPIKLSNLIGESNDSIEGDFQKHAISFLSEGSVNIDTMRQKLERIKKFVNYSNR